ncbi:L-threonylcarbamoyladenylate synthase [Thermosynechococcaceae cyanobacterium BACA0444]|uniref:L-threonylcarbamoyladenylate synthase n=1 Tax=Pseudocalidococcus azoricus BACA0444 TaxID=2918990 RepID=A0AAE4K105_9CYAN|nr:L-threonylcarbamoyladenylate synthase [Pseudocalidococcus azoricus]MDS3862347.1 L-threonylcarbamoyladenylate synthase [Pseudocalidococcus azoricus BACA0444]
MAAISFLALIAAVRSGEHLISFPTDTVPALACRPDQAGLIYQAKQRQSDKPLILMGASPESLWPYVEGSAQAWEIWQSIAATYWPGALTLILPASPRLPLAMNPENPTTIGLRIPNSDMARDILNQTGPLATTSINPSGQPPLLTYLEIQQHFPQVFTVSEDSWPPAPEAAIPSTVIKWNGTGWVCLRQGSIPGEKFLQV